MTELVHLNATPLADESRLKRESNRQLSRRQADFLQCEHDYSEVLSEKEKRTLLEKGL